MEVAIGALRDAQCISVRCLGTDCEGNHETYDCKDVVFISDGVPREDAEEHPGYEDFIRDGTWTSTATRTYPTALGYWYENVCDN